MVISFRLSGRRRRYHPPPPPACGHATAAASLEAPPPPPRPPWVAAVSRVDIRNAALTDLPERNGVDPIEADLEPSFVLNLFLDGYSIGEPGKGLLTYLIGDDPTKQPYSRASEAFFSDIEYGCLPLEVLHDIPCKFLDGSTLCEVRDYRFVSNGGDYSGDDFPKVNRVSLRLGTECVVKDLSSIVDASWTYHDQLIAESVILNALQPKLDLNPTSCLEILCSSKKIDLGIDKGGRHAKDRSLSTAAGAPENCNPDKFNACKSRTLCIEDGTLGLMQSEKLNSVLVNCPSMILINNAKSPAESDPNNYFRSYTLTNNSVLSHSKESASSIASEHLVQGNEMQAQGATLQGDSKNGQPKFVPIISRKRKKSSIVVQERHGSKKCSSPNKTATLNSQHSKATEKSTGTSSKERLELGSQKVIVDQTIDDKKINQELKFRRKRQKNVDTLTKSPSENNLIQPPCENQSAEEAEAIGGISSQFCIGVVVDNRKQETKYTSVLRKTTDSPDCCKLAELNIYTGTARCMENATLESMPSVRFNSLSVNYASPIHDNHVKSSVRSDCDNSIQSSKLPDSCARFDRKQSASRTAPDHLLQSIEQKPGNKSMEVPQQLPSPLLPTSHMCTSLNTSDPSTKKKPRNIDSMYVSFKEESEALAVDLDNSGMADLRGSTTPSVNSFNAGSRKASGKPHDKPATEPQFAATNRKVSGTSTVSSNQEIKSTKVTVDIQINSLSEKISEPPSANRLSEEKCVTRSTSRQWSESDIEKILLEVILTTQRHALNGKAARNDGLETKSSLVPSEYFEQENTQKYPCFRDEAMSYYATGRVMNSCKIRRIAFHPSQLFSCKGIVDDSHYTLCLHESQAPDDHQITVEIICGDEHMHIATLPTYCQAEKFVDQFILLMKRDGYNLCDDKVLTGPSELRQQREDISQLCHETGEYAQYLMLSPNCSAIEKNNDVGCTFLNRLPDFHVNLFQQSTQHWAMTQPFQSFETLGSFFLNTSHSGGLQHINRILQHTDPSFPCNDFTTNQHQFPSDQLSQQVPMDLYLQYRHDANNVFAMPHHHFPYVQLSHEVSLDRYWQSRHDVPGFNDMHGMDASASSYSQWRPVPTQLGDVVYQWDLPAFGSQINNSPLDELKEHGA